MDLKNLISSEERPAPDMSRSNSQPRMSIHDLVNADDSAIRQRSSITHLTNDEDVDMNGHKTVSLTRRKSSATSSEVGSPFAEVRSRKQPAPEQLSPIEGHKENKPPSRKPRRYTEKPTWAKDYIPTVRKSVRKPAMATAATKLSVASISGTIPRNDFNKVVTEWIWANIEGTRHEYKSMGSIDKYLELELKVGHIWDKVKDRRLRLPVNSETILNVDFFQTDCYFRSGVPAQQFHDLRAYLGKLSHEKPNHKANKFVVENSHCVDLIAYERKRDEKPTTGRVSVDVKTQRRMSSIHKHRVADLVIYLPNSLYDLRLSMSLELPYEMNDAGFESFQKRVELRRDKDRVSYSHLATFTKIDMTKVKENGSVKHEVELELDTVELLNSMAKIGTDPLYYIDLVQAFLDNGRIVSRQLSIQE
ncbi:hypothetical protein OGAPHI_001411 [Ogataea philodendri]|uniref:mRNA-capping enzyme subunit beta n=1 Tax=Ogataea philodendri TaxID=1378263 RepID=A0A9P8T8K1_9ASCO|nr:uncharacterized protein OGAPHI_001411 [Ogataea philodendri]KAH3669290.1 hypothetical protein OGAPHI_001411 [Ogataea philodendri]